MKRFLALILLSLLAASCAATYEETTSRRGRKHFIKLNEERGEVLLQNTNQIGKTLALFTLVEQKDIPPDVKVHVLKRFDQDIQGLNFFEKKLSTEAVDTILKESGRLFRDRDIYLETLGFASVSDRDLINPLSKALGADNVLVYHITLWPCAGCQNKTHLRSRLKLIDSNTGLILWTATAAAELEASELQNAEKGLLEMTDKLVEMFYHRYKRKWHLMRFERLKG